VAQVQVDPATHTSAHTVTDEVLLLRDDEVVLELECEAELLREEDEGAELPELLSERDELDVPPPVEELVLLVARPDVDVPVSEVAVEPEVFDSLPLVWVDVSTVVVCPLVDA